MAEKKLTKKDKFYMLRELVEDNEMLCEFIDHEIELLDKKATKPNKADKEKDTLTDKLYEVLVEINEPTTIGDLIAKGKVDFLEVNGLVSSQRVSAYLKKLVDCGKVSKYTDKKKTYFVVAD
jgi:hypothetical protein